MFAIAVTFLSVFTILGGLVGCYGINGITGSQNLETREYVYTNFSRVEVLSPFQVEIAKSNVYLVSITANDNLFNYIEVTQSGDTLRLRLKPFFSFRNTTFQATITMPDLRALEMSGASSVEVGEFQTTSDVDISISGASKLNIIGLQASNVKVDISGASRLTGFIKAIAADFEVTAASSIELNGSAVSGWLEASGASSLRLQEFSILNASVTVSGASNGSVEVNGKLDVEVSGASRLTFAGSATLGRVDVSGASSLNRR
jgi:hypothetical protein